MKLKQSLFPVYFVFFMDNFGFGLVFTIFGPLILNPQFGMLSPEMSTATRSIFLGLLFAAFPLTQLFGAPIIGDLADRFGRKKAFYITILGITFGYILSGVAILGHSYVFLFFSRLVTGFCAGNLSICLAAIADMSPDEKSRAKNYGMISTLGGVSWIFSMLIGGFLSDPSVVSFANPSIPFFLTAILSLLNLFAIAKMFHETHATRGKFKLDIIKGLHNIGEALQIKKIRLFYLVYFLYILAWGVSIQWFSPYALTVYFASQTAITWGLIVEGFFWAIGGSVLNRLMLARFSSYKTLFIGFILVTVFLIWTAFAPSYIMFVVAMGIFACLCSAFCWSNSMNLISISAPAAIQGKVMGLSQSAMSAAFIIGPLIAGYLGSIEIRWIYPFSVIIFILNTLILWSKHKKHHAKA